MTLTLTALSHSATVGTYNKPVSHRALLARVPLQGQPAWQLVYAHPVPALGEGQVLIKTSHVGLNPFDWQCLEYGLGVGPEGKVMGRDGAGVVVGAGSGVHQFGVGDRVWFCANSSLAGAGAFQEYSVHFATEVAHIPYNVSDDEAATLGTGLVTAGVVLFRTLDFPLDALLNTSTSKRSDAPWVLVWGGSGITGVYLIQLASIMGYRVICAASPVNHSYVRSLGADVVVDRWGAPSELIESIRTATKDEVLLAIDNVGSATATICKAVLQGSSRWRERYHFAPGDIQSTPGRLVALAGSPREASDVDAVRQVESPRVSFSTTFYNQPQFSERLLDSLTRLLANGRLLPARVKAVTGGLEGIETGLKDLRNGQAPGGYKLVARLADTPHSDTGHRWS